ncbi:MAG: metallophosphoesterase [bacterium]
MTEWNLVFSDIHSNYPALDTVLDDPEVEYDRVICAGDIVGYGPHPERCIDRLREMSCDFVAVKGNHDAGVTGELSTSLFNHMARSANKWTQQRLEEDYVNWLKSQPRTFESERFQVVHGCPGDEPMMTYVDQLFSARKACQNMDRNILFVGHTHIPAYYHGVSCESLDEHGVEANSEQVLSGKGYSILNPGSVGQPRDGNWRASYLLWNSESNTIRWTRVSYDYKSVQEDIREAGLPGKLATRLEYGQ